MEKCTRARLFYAPSPPSLSLNFFFFLFASNIKSIDHNEYVFYCGQYVREKKARACPPAASTTYIIITLLGAKKKENWNSSNNFFFSCRCCCCERDFIMYMAYVCYYTCICIRNAFSAQQTTHIHLNKLCAVETRVTLA